MSRCCSCMLPQPSVCRTQITSADLAELLYVQGLDVNLCEKFAPIANILQFRDCLGNIISANSQIVTCAQYANQLCDTLATLASGGAVTLGVTQVVGADCNTYVIPETPFTAVDTTTIDFTTSGAFGHTLTGIVKVSVDAGNIIEVHPDGLYVPTPVTACAQIASFPAGLPVILGSTPVVGSDCQTHVIPETPLIVVDSTTLDLSNSGAFGHTLTGDVKVSNQAGNQITIQPDGLYTPATPPTVLGVADTACINMSISGLPGSQVITADPIISPTAGNILQCTLNGLYVNVCATLAGLPNIGPAIPGSTFLVGKDCNAYTLPVPAPETPLTVIDTSCINLTTSGTAQHTLQADIVISGAPNNAIQCTPLGLFVPTDLDVNILAVDTSCINMIVNEAPANTFSISAEPVISPAIGNVLQCTAQGLYVPTPSSPLTFVDTNCINFDVVGTNVSATPVLSSTYPGYGTPCNSLQCTATGLAAPPDSAGSVGTIVGQILTDTNAAEGSANSQADVTLNIVNPSSCRSATLHIVHRVAQVDVGNAVGGTGGNYIIQTQAVHMFNLPGVQVTGFFVLTTQELNDTSNPATSLPGDDSYASDISFDFIVPPGFVGTYTGRSQYLIVQATSPIDVIELQPTILHYHLNTI